MANRFMWFNLLPVRTNSILGGRPPLRNIFSVIPKARAGFHTAIGACDGRKIFPTVFQPATFASDYDITIDEAIRQHRLDVTGTDQVTVMAHMDETIIRKLAPSFPSRIIRPSGINPNLFALQQIIQREA